MSLPGFRSTLTNPYYFASSTMLLKHIRECRADMYHNNKEILRNPFALLVLTANDLPCFSLFFTK